MYEVPGFAIGFLPADTDMSSQVGSVNGAQFNPVWIGTSANSFAYFGAALQAIGSHTDPPIGILQTNPYQGEAGNVMTDGVSKCWANGTWAIGDPIGWDAGGKLIKAVSGKFAIGTALMAGVQGQMSAIKLNAGRGVQ